MKQAAIIIFFIAFLLPALSQQNKDYKKVIGSYFKSSPFDKSPDSLVKELLNDTDLVIETLRYPTDTSLFYLRGYYKTFNPFSIAVNAVELLFYQSSTDDKDSLIRYREFICSVLGVLDQAEVSKRHVIEEEKRIFKNVRKSVTSSDYVESLRNAKYPSAGHDYNLKHIIPFYSRWEMWHRSKKDYCISISVNMSDLKHADALNKQLDVLF